MKNNQDERRLLKVLSNLSQQGPILSTKNDSNAVGKIMQEALEIKHSTTNRNSLFNFTITATASKLNSSGRTNLFACVPNWQSSPYKSSKKIVENFGTENLSKGYSKCLFCTVSSKGPNSFGLFLKINLNKPSIEEWHITDKEEHLVATWSISKIMEKLELLQKAAIISALPVEVAGKKAFHYRFVDLYEKPNFSNFLELIENGSITIDHCISIKVGQNSAREQGPLFKVNSYAREDLYQNFKRIDLMDL
jgi:hypothetical protein